MYFKEIIMVLFKNYVFINYYRTILKGVYVVSVIVFNIFTYSHELKMKICF